MVWGLIPVDSLPGPQKYYIFAVGTYKVGRKGCDVVIQTDRAVSRLHAEIIVDAMHQHASVVVKDLSKFGTFINKEQGNNNAVHTNPNKETFLKDGDVITFGTGNASFRFCFVSYHIGCSRNLQVEKSVQVTISSIGACVTCNWTSECTHMIAEEFSSVTGDIIDAIVAQKPVVRCAWFEVLAERGIHSEVPDCSDYVPTMVLDGLPVKVVEPKIRRKCLEGYAFVVGLAHLYRYKDKLVSLLHVCGAHVIQADDLCSNSQMTELISVYGDKNRLVLVKSKESACDFNHPGRLASLSRISETELILAILSGHLEKSKVQPPPVVVSSSHSTDETIVADSDLEVDTATSSHISSSTQLNNALKCGNDKMKEHNVKNETANADAGISLEKPKSPRPGSQDIHLIQRKHEGDDLGAIEYQNFDIIHSSGLIVRNIMVPSPVESVSHGKAVNFKRFRKANTSISGFKDLIPFSKEPYNVSEFGNENVSAYVREEKKRKQMEAIAEDLFNNAKAKKRGTAGSIHSFLARS